MRQTVSEIHLDHLTYNVKALTENVGPSTRFCGVVKANGYGHGAVRIAQHLVKLGADYLAVAVSQEAFELREAGIKKPILVLTPPEIDNLEALIKGEITLTVTDPYQAQQITKVATELETIAKVHLKVDSGMSRIGVQDSFEAIKVLRELESEYVNVEGIYTHFADADNMIDAGFTHDQFNHFKTVIEELEAKHYRFEIRHCCNSAATIRFPEYHLDMVRIGISLYGYAPDESMQKVIHLKPVMTVKTKVAFLKTLQPARKVGYGCTHEVLEEAKIATLVLGYADGVLRSLSNTGSFVLNNQKVPIVGRVCMDQLMVDVSHIDHVNVGDDVIWFGNETAPLYSLFDICKESGGFHYEMLTRISPRIPRVYID